MVKKYEYDSMWNVPIDMRHEFGGLLDEFGINMLYVRNNKFVRCRCFDDLNKTGDPDCKLCFGSGHFASISKVRAIESSNSPYNDTNAIMQLNIGVTDQKNEIYYLPHYDHPKERDVLIKVTWDKRGNPVDIEKVLEIVIVREMRGDNGRNELNGCVVDNRTDMVPVYNKILKSMNRKNLYIILNGGKGIWPDYLLKNN